MFFEVGKYYRCVDPEGLKRDGSNTDASITSHMQFMLDGEPHLCLAAGEKTRDSEQASFDRRGFWSWPHPEKWFEEVPAPAAQGKRMRMGDAPVGAIVRLVEAESVSAWRNSHGAVVQKIKEEVDDNGNIGVKHVSGEFPYELMWKDNIVEIVEQPFTGLHADVLFMDDRIGEVVLGPCAPGPYTFFGARVARNTRRKIVLGKIRTDQ